MKENNISFWFEKHIKYAELLATETINKNSKYNFKGISNSDPDQKTHKLKEIYNLWIDANEAVFAEYAQTEEYSLLYAGLVNSLVKFKGHFNELTDDILRAYNVPTSQGMAAIAKQQMEIKKELRETRDTQQKIIYGLEKLQTDLNPAKKKSVKKKTTGNKKKTPSRSAKKPTARKKSTRKKSTK